MEKQVKLGGSSGCKFFLDGDILTKKGKSLLTAYTKQLHAFNGGSLPFQAPKPFNFKEGLEQSFQMNWIDAKCFDPSLILPHEKSSLIYYFLSNRGDIAHGFKSLVINFINHKPDSYMNDGVLKLLESCSDTYLKGFCHGDLGPDNILFSNKECYLIDYTDAYIDSILFDIGIFVKFLRMNGSEEAISFSNSILSEFLEYNKQIEILGKLRAINFYAPENKNAEYFKKWFQV